MQRKNSIHIKPNVIRSRQSPTIPIKSIRPTVTRTNIIPTYTPSTSRVFIIGGGSSLIGFDFSKLSNQNVIAVNNAIEYVEHADYFVTMDYTFFKKVKYDIDYINSKCKASYFIVNMSTGNIKNINGTYTDTKFNIEYTDIKKCTNIIESNILINNTTGFSESNDNSFAHGDNSGFCAIQLAIKLGYEEIYLLGFDLFPNASMSTHFHNAYNQHISMFNRRAEKYRDTYKKTLMLTNLKSKIFSCSSFSYLNNFIKYINFDSIDLKKMNTIQNTVNGLEDLMIVGYYTIGTGYEEEAKKLITSCKKFPELKYDIVGVNNLGSWQSNTRFKAQFMLDMLNKHNGYRLLYVDCDAIFNKLPDLFINYSADIAVRYQDFSWRKNECLSGTIYMENNERIRELCKRWLDLNNSEGVNPSTFEQWNLGKIIEDMSNNDNLLFKNLPSEYCFIFDLMKKIYPNSQPVIEHFQKSRVYKKQI